MCFKRHFKDWNEVDLEGSV